MIPKTWDVECTDEFASWWHELDEGAQDAVRASIDLLAEQGTTLGHPRTSGILTSRHGRMRELRIQSRGRPLRIFYAFGPRRTAILLIGGNKAGDAMFYERMVSVADRLYDVYLRELREEGLI